MNVGVVGVGRMGLVAAKEVAAGFPVVVWDIQEAARQRAAAAGLPVAAGLPDLATRAELVLLFLPGPTEVGAIVAGEDGLLSNLAAGGIIIDLSTVDPRSTQRNAALANEAGLGYLDAPVLGRPAACGKWTLPVGGAVDDLERARPVLERLAKQVLHVGPSGRGNALKLLNNMMFAAINVITAEVMALCPKVGLDRRTFFEAVAGSGAATVSNLFLDLGPKMVADEYSPVFTVDLLHKDLALGMQMARESGAPPLASGTNLWLLELAQAHRLGALDSASLVKVYDGLFSPAEQTNPREGA